MYFCVTAKCGHVGRSNFILKRFAVMAENGKEAAYITRWTPRVKHHHKDAIISVEKIDYNDYCELKNENALDKYFKCKNIQEQRLNSTEMELLKEEEKTEYSKKRNVRYLEKKRKIKDKESNQMIKFYMGVA